MIIAVRVTQFIVGSILKKLGLLRTLKEWALSILYETLRYDFKRYSKKKGKRWWYAIRFLVQCILPNNEDGIVLL